MTDNAPCSVVVDIGVATKPNQFQQAAWTRLWGILLAAEHHNPAPAAPDGEGIDDTTGP